MVMVHDLTSSHATTKSRPARALTALTADNAKQAKGSTLNNKYKRLHPEQAKGDIAYLQS